MTRAFADAHEAALLYLPSLVVPDRAQADPPVPAYAAALKQRSAGRGTLALRRLLALYREYPRPAVRQAVTLAQQYGLFDLDRLERLTLRVIAKDYFLLSTDDEEPES